MDSYSFSKQKKKTVFVEQEGVACTNHKVAFCRDSYIRRVTRLLCRSQMVAGLCSCLRLGVSSCLRLRLRLSLTWNFNFFLSFSLWVLKLNGPILQPQSGYFRLLSLRPRSMKNTDELMTEVMIKLIEMNFAKKEKKKNTGPLNHLRTS